MDACARPWLCASVQLHVLAGLRALHLCAGVGSCVRICAHSCFLRACLLICACTRCWCFRAYARMNVRACACLQLHFLAWLLARSPLFARVGSCGIYARIVAFFYAHLNQWCLRVLLGVLARMQECLHLCALAYLSLLVRCILGVQAIVCVHVRVPALCTRVSLTVLERAVSTPDCAVACHSACLRALQLCACAGICVYTWACCYLLARALFISACVRC
jgi:hypothetical protein